MWIGRIYTFITGMHTYTHTCMDAKPFVPENIKLENI